MKRSTGKTLAVVLPLIFAIGTGLHFLLKEQHRTYQFKIPASSALVFKIQTPLDFADDNPTLYEWIQSQNLEKHKQQVLKYFQKGLKTSDYTIEDLLGNKQIYYVLSSKLKSCVVIPLNKNDHFFIDAITLFFESKPRGLNSESQNYYSIMGEVKTYIKLDENYLIISNSKADIENLISKQKDSASITLIGEKDELRINQKALLAYFGESNDFSLNNIYLSYFMKNIHFQKTEEDYKQGDLTESILNILDNQRPIKKKLLVPESEHSTYLNISNGIQFKEDLMTYSRIKSLKLETKQAEFESTHNISISELYQNINGIVSSHDLNPSGNKLLRTIRIPVNANYSLNTKKITFEKANTNDTLWHTVNFNLNQLLFGRILPSNPLRFFSVKKGEIILYENIEAFDAYSSVKINSIEIKDNYEEHLTPNRLVKIFNRTLEKTSPISSLLSFVETLKISYSNKELFLNIKFTTLEKKQRRQLKGVYDFSQDFSSILLLEVPYKNNPYAITTDNEVLSIWNNKREQIFKVKAKGKLISITKKNNIITIFTEFNSLKIENLQLVKRTNFKNKIFYKSNNQEDIITQNKLNYTLYNSKGKKKKEFQTKDTLQRILNSEGLFYTTNDTSLSILNTKGRIINKYTIKRKVKVINCFKYSDTYYTINNLGEISPFSSNYTESQILGDLHLLENPLEIIESSPNGIQFYTKEIYKAHFFKQLLAPNLNISKIKQYYLIHDLYNHKAMIISASGKVVMDEFKLSPRGKIILQENKIFRLDNFGKSYRLDYTRL